MSILISVLLVCAGNDVFNVFQQHTQTIVEVTALGNKNDNSNSTEVWLTGISLDGSNMDMASMKYPENWELREGALLSYKEQPSTIKLILPEAKKIELRFLEHDWSGNILIKDGSKREKVELYSKTPSIYKYNVTGNVVNVSTTTLMLSFTLATILIASIVFLFLMLSTHKSIYFGVFYAVLSLFVLTFVKEFDILWTLVVCMLNFAIGISFVKLVSSGEWKKYIRGIWMALIFVLLTLYISFNMVGNLFNENGLSLTIDNVSKIILVNCLIFIMLFTTFINLLKVQVVGLNRKKSKLTIILYSLPFLVVGLIYWLSFYPAVMSPDSISQWSQVVSGKFDDWHPVFHTLLIKLIFSIWPSPALVSFVQVLCISMLLGYVFYQLDKLGIKKIFLWLLIAWYSINPVNGIMSITLWKDIPFSFSVLILTILLFKIYITEAQWLNSNKNQLILILGLLAVYFLRHNGITSVGGTLLILLLLYRKELRKLLKIGAVTIAVIFIIKVPIFHMFNIVPGPSYLQLILPMHQVGTMIHENVELKDNESKIISEIMPLSEWHGGDNYTRYLADFIVFNKNFNSKYIEENRKEFLASWISIAVRNPKIAISDYLAMTSLVWQIQQPDDGYANTAPKGIIPNKFGLEQKSIIPKMKDFLNAKIISFTETKNHIWLFWRPAVHLFLIMLFGFIFIRRNTFKGVIFLVPILCQAAGLLLVIPGQDSRFLYSASLVAPIIIILSFIKIQSLKEEDSNAVKVE